MTADIDPGAYLDRIGLAAVPAPTESELVRLHAAHALTIPFENLDIHLGRGIDPSPGAVFDKLVRNRKGGFCFEQNSLLYGMLDGLGFTVRRLMGRVTFNATAPRPRTHLINLVEIGERSWIADVGFGVYGFVEPVPFEIDRVHEAGDEAYRIVAAAGTTGFEMQARVEGDWRGLYWFSLDPCYDADVVMGSFYHSNYPHSPFVQERIVGLPGRGVRRTLLNGEFKIREGRALTVRTLTDEAEYRSVLEAEFGIVLPADARLKPLPGLA